jgi:hypothetical protein
VCRFSPQKGKTKLQRETERIEDQFRRKKEEKVRKMLERLSSEQRVMVASLIQKHAQQMLELIAEKLSAFEVSKERLSPCSYFFPQFNLTFRGFHVLKPWNRLQICGVCK